MLRKGADICTNTECVFDNHSYLTKNSSIGSNGERFPNLFCTEHTRFCCDCELVMQKDALKNERCAHFEVSKNESQHLSCLSQVRLHLSSVVKIPRICRL